MEATNSQLDTTPIVSLPSKNPPSYNDITSNKLVSPPILAENSSTTLSPTDLDDYMITISLEDTNRLYSPWQYSLIVKAFVSKFTHQYLKTKLEALRQLLIHYV